MHIYLKLLTHISLASFLSKQIFCLFEVGRFTQVLLYKDYSLVENSKNKLHYYWYTQKLIFILFLDNV